MAGGGSSTSARWGGLLAMLGGGAYYASKHALEALCDALRAEVVPFGIDVVVIEPGLVWSGYQSVEQGSEDVCPVCWLADARGGEWLGDHGP
ncbi:MAG TPA: SDR family NAD(P)-dependent oxidoreductase, partial [Streptosporangiaceae bacterium]